MQATREYIDHTADILFKAKAASLGAFWLKRPDSPAGW